MTQDLIAIGKLLEIKVLDHVVIGQGRFVSIRDRTSSQLEVTRTHTMSTAAQHNRQRPTATIETGHIVQSTDQAQADTEAAITLLQTIAPWLARKLVEGGIWICASN